MKSERAAEPFLPSSYECSLIMLHLVHTPPARKKRRAVAKQRSKKETSHSRIRVSELTLKRLFSRQRIHPNFLVEVQDWLLLAGWVLFFAGGSFAMIKVNAVQQWTRLGSKRISDDLDKVAVGDFDFTKLQYLEKLSAGASRDSDD